MKSLKLFVLLALFSFVCNEARGIPPTTRQIVIKAQQDKTRPKFETPVANLDYDKITIEFGSSVKTDTPALSRFAMSNDDVIVTIKNAEGEVVYEEVVALSEGTVVISLAGYEESEGYVLDLVYPGNEEYYGNFEIE